MLFYEGQNCSSVVGIHHGPNRISLSKGCWNKETAAHEIGHALSKNVKNMNRKAQFLKILFSVPLNYVLKQGRRRGTPYDYRSVMHYDKAAFGRERVTMETKDK